MPVIKPYVQRVAPEGTVGGQATGSDFGGPGLYQVGQAVEKAGSDAAQAFAIIQHNKSRNEATDADLKVTLFAMDRETDLLKRRQTHKVGDPDFTDEALAEFTAKGEKLRYNDKGEDQFTTSYGQRTYASKMAHVAKQYSAALGRVQAEIQGEDVVHKLDVLTAAHSNRVALGQNYLTVQESLQEFEQSARTGTFQIMGEKHPAKFEELIRQRKGVIANSAVDGLIRDNPRGALSALQGGFLSDVLTKDQTSTLLDKAQTGVHMVEAEDRRKNEAVEHAAKLGSESSTAQVSNAYLTARADQNYNPYDTQRQIFEMMKNKPNMTGPQIMSIVGALDSDIKEAKSGSTQGNVDLDRRLFAKIAAGKMPDITEINQARAQPNHPISATQHEELIKEWNTARTPEGRSLQIDMDAALKSVETMVMPKDLTGVLADPESGLRMAKLTHDVRVQIDKDRREGKNPQNRLNPDSPDYMFTKERLKQYVTPFLERIRKSAERLAEQPGLPKTAEGGTVPEFQRKPGESTVDWKKRTGQ